MAYLTFKSDKDNSMNIQYLKICQPPFCAFLAKLRCERSRDQFFSDFYVILPSFAP
jgi:hypothetical protein